MTQKHIIDKKVSGIIAGIILVLIFIPSFVIAYVTTTFNNIGSNTVYGSGNLYVYFMNSSESKTLCSAKISTSWSVAGTGTAKWNNCYQKSNSITFSMSEKSGTIAMSGSKSTVKSMTRSSSSYCGDTLNYSDTYYYYVNPSFTATVPAGYHYYSGGVKYDVGGSGSGFALGIPVALSNQSTSERNMTFPLYLNTATPGLKTINKKRVQYAKVICRFAPDTYSYTVSNTGTGGTAAGTKQYTVESGAITLSAGSKQGYTFKGWSGSNTSGTIPQGSVGNKNFTANWTANSGTITYNGNGNTGGSTRSSSYTYDSTDRFSANGFIREGYSFTGWNTDKNGNGSDYPANASSSAIKKAFPTGSGTLYAQWEANEGTIEFDGNGGEGSMEEQDYIYGSTAVLNRNLFENEGYRFTSWNTKRDGSGQAVSDMQGIKNAFPIKSGESVTLYAQWEPLDYTIKYDGNRSSGGKMEDREAEFDRTAVLDKCKYYKKGFVFKNWITEQKDITFENKQTIRINSNLLNGTDDPVLAQTLDSNNRWIIGAGEWGKGTFYYASDNNNIGRRIVDIDDPPVESLNKAVEMDCNNTTNDIAQANVPVITGKTYTVSCYAKGHGTLYLGHGNGTYESRTNTVDSGEWKSYHFTFTAGTVGSSTNNLTNIYFGNRSQDTNGKMLITGLKLEEGDEATQYIRKDDRILMLYANWTKGRFILSGDTHAEGYQFQRVSTENGKLHIDTKLRKDKFFSIFDIDEGAIYQITEGANRKYRPSYTVTEGKEFADNKSDSAEKDTELSTSEESLLGNTTYDFLNSRDRSPEGHTLKFRKKITGDLSTEADRSKYFMFSYCITGLDPDSEYSATYSGSQEGSSFYLTPDPQGSLSGTIELKHDEFFSIEGLPKGAEYNITEMKGVASLSEWQYKSSYEVIEGTERVEHDAQGLGVETMGDENVEYVFRNSKASVHDLTIKKAVEIDGNSNIDTNDNYTVRIFMSNLDPLCAYSSSSTAYSFTSDQNGKACIVVNLKNKDEVTFFDLPGDVWYEACEDSSRYTADVKVYCGEEMIYETSGLYGQGVSVNSEDDRLEEDKEIGFDSDQLILFTNSKKTTNTLKISKQTEGRGTKSTDEFSYNIDFTGLDPKKYEVIKEATDDDGEVTDRTSYVFRPLSSEASYSFTLKNLESLMISGLPDTASYTITEEGSDGYTPSYEFVTGSSLPDAVSDEGEPLSTETERLLFDTQIDFVNYKDTPPPQKTVSDEDDKTWTGSGAEINVKENTVPDVEACWSYKVSQKVYPGYETFEFIDTLPKNVVLESYMSSHDGTSVDEQDYSDDIVLKWTKADGTVFTETVVPGDDESSDSDYKSEHFSIDLSASSIGMVSEDPDFIGEGGDFEISFNVRIDPDSEMSDFKNAGELYKINERLVFKNTAVTTLDDNEYISNTTRTNIPLNVSLTIGKNVTGNLGDRTKEFEFKLNLFGLEPNQVYPCDDLAYIKITCDYSSENILVISARTEKDEPVSGLMIVIYSIEEDSQNEDEEYSLYAKRKTNEHGIAHIRLVPGSYKYAFTYDDEETSGLFTAVHNEDAGGETDQMNATADGLEEVFLKRTNYDIAKSFRTDENGNAEINFKLKDDGIISFANLPKNVSYQITEAASNHIPSYEVTRGSENVTASHDSLAEKEESLSTRKETLNESTEFIFTNKRELEPRTAAYIGLSFLLLIAGACLLILISAMRKAKSPP